MDAALAIAVRLFLFVIGGSVFAALMFFAMRAISQFWREVATRYAGQANSPRLARKFPETVVMTGQAAGDTSARFQRGWHVYAAVWINLHEDGLVLRSFNIMCPPLFLPFAEMEMADTSWPTLRQPVAIRMRGAPHIDLVIRDTAARWIRDRTPAIGAGVSYAFDHTL